MGNMQVYLIHRRYYIKYISVSANTGALSVLFRCDGKPMLNTKNKKRLYLSTVIASQVNFFCNLSILVKSLLQLELFFAVCGNFPYCFCPLDLFILLLCVSIFSGIRYDGEKIRCWTDSFIRDRRLTTSKIRTRITTEKCVISVRTSVSLLVTVLYLQNRNR